jgi:hypothetical protein
VDGLYAKKAPFTGMKSGEFGVSSANGGGPAGDPIISLRRSGAGWSGLQLGVKEGDLLQNGVNDVLVSEMRVDH